MPSTPLFPIIWFRPYRLQGLSPSVDETSNRRGYYSATVLFLLPAGRPRRRFSSVSSLIFAIQAGGRPLRFAPPAARRSRLRLASPNCSRSKRRSARILLRSIFPPNWHLRLIGL